MSQYENYTMQMQGGDQKEPEKQPPPIPPAPERRRDTPNWEPDPLTESEIPPNQIEPDKGWERE